MTRARWHVRSKWRPIWDVVHPRSPHSSGSDKLSHKTHSNISPKNFICGARKQNLPGTCFSKVPVTFRARKAVLCLLCLHSAKVKQSFNHSENNKMKLSVDEAKLTGLWARTVLTIQLVWILKFAFGPEKFPGLSRNGPLV